MSKHIIKNFFAELFGYIYNANRDIISLMNENEGQVSERSLALMSHILNVQHLWNKRVLGESSKYKPWDVHPLPAFNAIDDDNYQTSLQILDDFDPDSLINYTTSFGKPFTHSVRDMLFQAINHATYHRGQIISDLKQSGISPITTDYIFYKMEKAV
jgi:uncharacterized damage-inducible protein DinB